MAVSNILRQMLRLSAAAGISKKSTKESSRSYVSSRFQNILVVKYLIDLKKRLEAQRAGKLVLMATIVCISLVINLYITISTAPVLEQFKRKTDEWRECNLEFRVYCSGLFTCQSPATQTCSAHSDCIAELEYCTSGNRCEPCFRCGVDVNGVDGLCPALQCALSSKMQPRELCAFHFCAAEVVACVSNLTCVGDFRALLEGTKTTVPASREMVDAEDCLDMHACQEAEAFCKDPYPECKCAAWDSYLIRNESNGVKSPSAGCHVGPVVTDKDLMVHAMERNRNVCIVEDPAKCLEMGAFLGDGLSWYSEAVKFRDGCCASDDPPPTSEGSTEHGGCGEQPSDAPSVASLSIGFFVLNFIPILPCIVFGRSDSFKKTFQPITSKMPMLRRSTRVSGVSGAASGASSGASHGASSVVSSIHVASGIQE
jgi:hypothetical protein